MEQILDQVDSNTEHVYAGFWVRAVAAFIDGLIVSFVQNLVTYALYQESFYSGVMFYNSMSLGFLISLGYHTYFLSSEKQATLGKQAMGIKVVTLKGERLTPINAAGRFFASYLSAIILFIGYLMVAFDSKKQALHDKLVGTYVVRN
ncbi:MAG TPA: RDD family protein [Cytophagaceae bacterium]|jgi:uncharacterized RDD family membrane protein YckC|nr:RDD family protein [Cytophagaceae bacterium]